MAIYSLSHTPIGRSTHDAGTAGAHLCYITRTSACRAVIGDHMPIPAPGRVEHARTWMDNQEKTDRKNARVVDKFTLALPIELDADQRMDVVQRFAQRLTRGETPWLAAIHDEGKDAHNPHCHFVLRDRHIETGKRAIGMSEKGSTNRVRLLWEQVANEALERAGSEARIDRRSLKAQGITDHEPQKHIGPAAKAIEEDRGDSWKLEAIRNEEDYGETQSGPDNARQALDVDQARLDAAEVQKAAKDNLASAKRNLKNAQEILDGNRDLMTGHRKFTGKKSTLPPRRGPLPTDEEIAHEEYLAMYCDEDGDETFSSPRPYLIEYQDMQNGQHKFNADFAAWQTVERARIARIEKSKRKIWEAEFPVKRNQLRAINKLDAAEIVGETLQLARSIFDWMHRRFLVAINFLGEKHDLIEQMQSDWGKTLAENKKTHDLVLGDHLEQKQKSEAAALPIWGRGKQAWLQVEARREAHKTVQKTRNDRSHDNGPKM